jgi:streptogramin lyase
MKRFCITSELLCGLLVSVLSIGSMIEVKAEALAISTFAGRTPSPGFQDGLVGEATFGWVTGVALDGAGNLYVADASAHAIRKITPEGMVSTLAGKLGESGSANGVGSEARLYSPRAVAVDGEGNVYAAEEVNSTIRKITPEGVVSTFAGMTGQDGTADGVGEEARFYLPRGLAVDGDGNVLVADQGHGRIRRITPEGMVTTLPGAFTAPEGLAVDAEGNIFIGDWRAHRIYKLTSEGVTVVAGRGIGYRDGPADMASFYDPTGVALDGEGNVYVADTLNHAIRKVGLDGMVTTVAGLGGMRGGRDGAAADARFQFPRGVVVDPEGILFIADTSNYAIRKISTEGEVSTLSGGEGGAEDGAGHEARFFLPGHIDVGDDGTLHVVDAGNHAVRRITPEGEVSTLAGELAWPGNADGAGVEARFQAPKGIAVDGSGNVYVADTGNYTIRKVAPTGEVTTFAGLAGASEIVDGTGSEARFQRPAAVAVDAQGNLFVAEETRHVIRRITPEGVVTTFAGKAGESGCRRGGYKKCSYQHNGYRGAGKIK